MIQHENKKRKKLHKPSQVQFIAGGFLLMIIIGALLLMLPISSRDGMSTDFLSAVFTATSASCVTGLVVYDTYSHWSLFGQLVIITMIQIGGLGFITIGIFFATFFRLHIGLNVRNLMQESTSALQLSGMVKLAKNVVLATLAIEAVGALFLSIRFIPSMGLSDGIYYSIFHSISAFCNAGFDLMGKYEPYSSFVAYRDDPLVNIVFCILILVGGLGFMVWEDLWKNRFRWKGFKLHTRLVLVGTLFFTAVGAVLFWIFERDNLLIGVSPVGQIMASLFGSVTPRTAGFNTTDTGALSNSSQLLTLILMLVGGNSGSTAGGAKVTTFMVLFLFIFATLQQSSQVEVFNRRLKIDIVKKAAVVFTINLSLGFFAAMIICGIQPVNAMDALFETFSAINTVGMTRNLTRELLPASRIIIIILMYCGRIGSLTFAFSLLKKKNTDIIKAPAEDISVG